MSKMIRWGPLEELRGEDKDRYMENIIRSLSKLEKSNQLSREVGLLKNLLSFYFFDSKYKSNQYLSTHVNKFSGFPSPSSLGKLVKDKQDVQNMHVSEDERRIFSKVKKSIIEGDNLEEIRENHGLIHYYDKIRQLPILEFNSASVEDSKLFFFLDSGKWWVKYTLLFEQEPIEEKIVSLLNSPYRPDNAERCYDWFKVMLGLSPQLLIREQIGPFLSYLNQFLPQFRPFANLMKEDKRNYLLYSSKEVVESRETEQEYQQKILFFQRTRKKLITDRSESQKKEFYICNPPIFRPVKEIINGRGDAYIVC